jgi:hypothetical protein
MLKPVLKAGSHGPAVKELKVLLNRLLKPSPELDTSNANYFGKTAEAVRRFQAAHKLHVDGVVGKDTWRALQKLAHSGMTAEGHHAAAGPRHRNEVDKGVPTDGVTNSNTRDPTPEERKTLAQDMEKARKWITDARVSLTRVPKDEEVRDNFLSAFVPGAITGTGPQLEGLVKKVDTHYQDMLTLSTKVPLRIQTVKPITSDGGEALAFADLKNGYIAVWKDPKKQGGYPFHLPGNYLRYEILIHELAHLAGKHKPGHAYNATSLREGIEGADRYADYAVSLKGFQ